GAKHSGHKPLPCGAYRNGYPPDKSQPLLLGSPKSSANRTDWQTWNPNGKAPGRRPHSDNFPTLQNPRISLKTEARFRACGQYGKVPDPGFSSILPPPDSVFRYRSTSNIRVDSSWYSVPFPEKGKTAP